MYVQYTIDNTVSLKDFLVVLIFFLPSVIGYPFGFFQNRLIRQTNNMVATIISSTVIHGTTPERMMTQIGRPSFEETEKITK